MQKTVEIALQMRVQSAWSLKALQHAVSSGSGMLRASDAHLIEMAQPRMPFAPT